MLTDLVLAVCIHTALACNDIAISYKTFPLQRVSITYNVKVQAQAYMTSFGNYGIWFDKKYADYTLNRELLRLVVHEISHLEVFVEDIHAADHGTLFRQKCHALSRQVGVNPTLACEGTKY